MFPRNDDGKFRALPFFDDIMYGIPGLAISRYLKSISMEFLNAFKFEHMRHKLMLICFPVLTIMSLTNPKTLA